MSETTILAPYTGSALTADSINEPRVSQNGNLVPRNQRGVPEDGAGNCGLPNLQWETIYARSAIINGRTLGSSGSASGGGVFSHGSQGVLAPGGNDGYIINPGGNSGEQLVLTLADGTQGTISRRRSVDRNFSVRSGPDNSAELQFDISETEGLHSLGGLRGVHANGEVVNPRRGTSGGGDAFANDIIWDTRPSTSTLVASQPRRFIRLRNIGANIAALEGQLAAFQVGDEVVVMEVFNRNNPPAGGDSLGNGLRGNMLRTFTSLRGVASSASTGDAVRLLDLQYLYGLPLGTGDLQPTETNYPSSNWNVEPEREVIIWHRGVDGATLRRGGGQVGAPFEPYNGVFLGLTIWDGPECVATLSAPRIGYVDNALRSPFGGSLEIRRDSDGGSVYTTAPSLDTCLDCTLRTNWEPTTSATFDASDNSASVVGDLQAGDTYFAYAPLAVGEDVFVSNQAPLIVNGGDRLAYVSPILGREGVCIAAFRGQN